jgi:anaerobic magnesium-protoporphyrin IX monomethyl ester cyclase
MKVVALNPPFLKKFSRASRSPAVTKSGTIYFPTWLAYATGSLEKAGHEVKLIDACAAGVEVPELLDTLRQFEPALVLMDSSTASHHSDVQVAAQIKVVLPKAFIAMVGLHVSALPTPVLSQHPAVDAVCRREYDLTAVDLANALTERRALSTVEGLSFRDETGQVVHNPDRAYIQDLDALPFVTEIFKKHLRIEDYFYAHIQYPMVTTFTSRGCPAQCTWCMYPQVFYGHGFRHRSPESIVAEFEYIQRELPQVKEVLIDDDTFTIKADHTRRTCELMIERGITLAWTCEVRTNLDYDTMVVMKKAGCRLMVTGFESGVKDVLKAMKKGVGPEHGVRFAADARRAGIMVHGCFVAGNPGETRETLEETLRYAKTLTMDTAQFFPMMLYPGTEAYEWAKKNGFLRTEDYTQWLTSDGLHNTMIDRPGLSHEYLVEFCDRARREFYLRPRYLSYKLWQAVTNPAEFQRTLKSARRFYRFLFPKPAAQAPAGSARA